MTPLPPGWEIQNLGDIADVVGGIAKDSKRNEREDHIEVPYLRVANVQRGYIDTTNVSTIRVAPRKAMQLRLQPGDVLLNEGGDRNKLGRGWVWQGQIEDCIHQNHVFRARIHGDVLHPKLLAWYANEVAHKWFEDNGKQSVNLASISLSKIRTFPVPIPPVDEQSRIVDILEGHLSRLDAAGSSLFAAQRRVTSFHRTALSHAICKSDRELVPLGDVVRTIEAGRSFGGAAGPAAPGEWGVIRVSAMTWGTFRASENKRVPSTAVDPRHEIRSGDLLLSRANTSAYVGASVFVEDVQPRLLLSDKSLRILPHPEVSGRWLQLALSTPFCRSQMSAKATGTKDSMRNISQAALLSIQVPRVDAVGQAEDIEEMSAYSETERRLLLNITRSQTGNVAMRRALLAAAFSGQLTGAAGDLDRAEEMASV